MEIVVKAFGPEITDLIGRELVVKVTHNTTMNDLIKILDELIRGKHGLGKRNLRSFSILLNGRNIQTVYDKVLRVGDTVTILSPIGGG